MGRPKKKLTDNSVKVRYKTLADGRKSVYLDCCDGCRRTYDFLKLYILPETDREAVRRNKATMKKVEEIQRERTLQLMGIGNGGTGDKPVFHMDMPLSEWMDAYIGEQKRYGVKNTAIITKVARILGTIAPDVRMSQVDKDFCLMFIDYLRNDYRARSGQPINRKVYEATIGFFDNLLHLLHPFMPFITEELWQHLCDRTDGESLMVSPLSMSALVDEDIIREFEVVKEVISNIRSIRLQKNIAQKETLELQVIGENPVVAFNAVIMKMCNLSSINIVENKADGAASFMVGTTEYAVPLGNMIDVEAEIARMEAELKHKEGFLQGVLKKLGNEKFVNNAPAAVLEMERKKQADAESIIKSLKESIAALKKA